MKGRFYTMMTFDVTEKDIIEAKTKYIETLEPFKLKSIS